ncbi:hypothetical protein RIR_jg18649.t1 [Rhizophagus irregularis DAOM 181602=DAOM 197198]|nr:hypothetical protein RIR_jg18649.t1 [Rhizophagus irregularis DAOM 181602=DAOM 197198]
MKENSWNPRKDFKRVDKVSRSDLKSSCQHDERDKGKVTTYVHEQQNRSKDICAGDVLNASGDLRTDNAELKFSVP